METYITNHSGNKQDAEDIFQESISAAWLNLRQGRFSGTPSHFNAYLRQICKYKWINKRKSAAVKNISLGGDENIPEQDDNQIAELKEQIKQSSLLESSLSSIGDKCRELLTLYYFKKQSLASIATQMNHTEESVKTTKYRCMMKLRKIYLETE